MNRKLRQCEPQKVSPADRFPGAAVFRRAFRRSYNRASAQVRLVAASSSPMASAFIR